MAKHNILKDVDNRTLADWYISDPPRGFVVDFRTLDSTECREILDHILWELEQTM